MNSRRMSCAAYGKNTEEEENAPSMLVRNLNERDQLRDLGIDGRKILEWVLKE
jgi:hypothetical protein